MQGVQIFSNKNYPIGDVINQKLMNSEKTQIAVAFLKSSGIKIIENSLLYSLDKGWEFELIVGLDFKTTDPKAIKYFIDLKEKYSKLKFYCYGDRKQDKNIMVFHPKIYLFKHKSCTTAILGSSNLTAGGLISNFEVNTVFSETNPEYYTQLESIYNSVKYTDSLFVPDYEYLIKYSDVFKSFSQNEVSASKDPSIKKIMKEIIDKEFSLPGTVPSINSMIVELFNKKKAEHITELTLQEIYTYLDKKIEDPIFEGRYKLDTFHNTIRGELNHNEESNTDNRSMKLYKRTGKGLYSLTEKGMNFRGR